MVRKGEVTKGTVRKEGRRGGEEGEGNEGCCEEM